MRLTTTDLYESGFLVSAGAHLAEIWNGDERSSTVIFVFEEGQRSSVRLEELQHSYHNGTARVNLSDYRRSLETVKDRMFAVLRNRTGVRASKRNPRRTRNERQIIPISKKQV